MKRTPLRPGSPPVRKAGLRRTAWKHCTPELLASGVSCAGALRRPCRCGARGSHDHKVESAEHESTRRTRREQIQRMERFGTYAWLIRVLPCAGCYPMLYKGETRLRQTVREFSAYVLGKWKLSEAAHLKSVGAGGLADGNLLPLCHGKCHQKGPGSLHVVGPSTFANRIGLPLERTAKAIAATPQGKALLSIDRRVVKALRDLAVHPLASGVWHVTGGGSAAGQAVTRDQPLYPPCTCQWSKANPDRLCKHRIAVRLYEGARLDTVLREVVTAELSV